MAYENVDSQGNKYRVRFKFGPHGYTETGIDNVVAAAIRADEVRAWLRACLPDAMAEKHQDTLCHTSCPKSAQTREYFDMRAAIKDKQGDWQTKIQTAPKPIADFITRVFSFPLE